MAEFLMIDPTKFAENNKQKSLAPHQRSNKISKKELDANNRFFFFFFSFGRIQEVKNQLKEMEKIN
jgi:hypothetical protein